MTSIEQKERSLYPLFFALKTKLKKWLILQRQRQYAYRILTGWAFPQERKYYKFCFFVCQALWRRFAILINSGDSPTICRRLRSAEHSICRALCLCACGNLEIGLPKLIDISLFTSSLLGRTFGQHADKSRKTGMSAFLTRCLQTSESVKPHVLQRFNRFLRCPSLVFFAQTSCFSGSF